MAEFEPVWSNIELPGLEDLMRTNVTKFFPIFKISGRRIWWHYETHSILPWRSASLIIMKFFYKIGKQNLLLGLKVINCNLIFRFCFWPMISLLNTGWNENQWRSGSIHKHWLALFRLVINFHFEHSIMRYLIIGTNKRSIAIPDSPECIRHEDKNLS